jgi:hypothetical protein
MTFTLKIDLDNDAFFTETKHEELVRILREISDHLEEHGGLMGSIIRDLNGNKVGVAKFT